MSNQHKKVVNAEEQNRTVNPGDINEKENMTTKEQRVNNGMSDTPETEDPDKGSEIETPHRIEGDDAGRIEKKIPNM